MAKNRGQGRLYAAIARHKKALGRFHDGKPCDLQELNRLMTRRERAEQSLLAQKQAKKEARKKQKEGVKVNA